jgi:hypothetical protein
MMKSLERSTRTGRRLPGLVLLIIILLPLSFIQAQLTMSGSDDVVNSTTANRQGNPAVAMDTARNYVIVWESLEEDGDGYGIYAQRYNSDGTTNGAAFKVNGTNDGEQRYPDVAMSHDGNFVVVWMSDHINGSDWDIFRKVYDNTGATIASQIRVNSNTIGHQRNPRVATAEDGAFVVVWHETDTTGITHSIEGRRYDNAGAALASEFVVNASPAAYMAFPAIASDTSGNFMVVWQSSADGNANGISGIIYDSTGAAVTADLSINSTTSGNQIAPDVALLSDGNYAVTWASNGQDASGYGIYATIVDDAGSVVLSEFLVNDNTGGNQEFPRITATIDEGFIICWDDYGQDGSFTGKYAALYSTAGSDQGSDIIVNDTTALFQQFGDVAWKKRSAFPVFTWQSGFLDSVNTQDSDDYGVIERQGEGIICTVADMPTLAGAPGNYCPGDNQTINITGNLNDATQWALYTDSCGGAPLDSTMGTSFIVSVSEPTTYHVRGIGNCPGFGDCGTVTLMPNDTVKPEAVCSDITVHLNGSGSAAISGADLDGGSTDNCSVFAYTPSVSSFVCADTGVNNVLLTVSDELENEDTCTAVVTVVDSTAPAASCLNPTVYLDASH